MSTPQERSRNNVRAGIFVTVVLAAGFFIIVVLSEAWTALEPMKSYTIRFSVEAGAEGLKAGSEVRVGGVRQGSVTGEPKLLDEGGQRNILVPIKVDSRIVLYRNAQAIRTAPLLGSIASINFANMGDAAAGVLAPGSTLDAVTGLGMLESFLGSDSARDTRAIIKDFRTLADRLPQDYETQFLPMVADAREFVGAVKGDYERWRATIDKVMDKANSIAESADASMHDIRDFVAAKRPDVERIVDNVGKASQDIKAVTERFRAETMDKVTSLLDHGSQALESFQKVGKTVEEWVDAAIPELNQMMADGRLASGQIKLASMEIRRSPWKLIYRPSPDELQHELLYEAARSFALAASDLKAASESVDRLLATHGDALQGDREIFQQMQRNLAASFQNYERAQQRLIDVLLAPAP